MLKLKLRWPSPFKQPLLSGNTFVLIREGEVGPSRTSGCSPYWPLSTEHEFILVFIYLFIFFEREMAQVRGGQRENSMRGRERERERERSRAHPTWGSCSLEVGLEPTNLEIMTRAEVRCLTEEPPRLPSEPA